MDPVFNYLTMAAIAPFPELPTELVLHILSCACYVSHETALNVSRVSSWVRSIVLPIVFSTVVRRAGPTIPSTSGWATPQGIRPSAVLAIANERGYAHILPPSTCDVGKLVKHLWIESIDMMSSPGELGILNACMNIEDVALTASSLRMLYNSTLFGKLRSIVAPKPQSTTREEVRATATPLPVISVALQAGSRVKSITLTKPTFRYDWHFLVDINSAAAKHASLLANITHLRLTNMEKSTYIPTEYLPCLTHVALPYLHLRSNGKSDVVRVPDEVLQKEEPALKMVVLTVDEREWLYKPWRHGAHSQRDSPRDLFNTLVKHAQARDERLSVVLSPRIQSDICGEWAEAARGNSKTVWELAESVQGQEEYANVLPTVFPPSDIRYGSE